MNILKKHMGWIFVVVLTIFAIIPLFHSGFFPMHDDEQIARLFDLNQALTGGDFPPRIAPNLGFGYGYPFFNFYPSFAYYVGEAFHLLGFGYIVSTKLMLVSGFVLSALFMYLFTKEFFGRAGAVVAAVAYTYLPYHAVDVYVRGAFAEFYAFVFLPLIFWSFFKLAKTGKSVYIIPSALSLGFLILSHNLIAFMSMPFIGIWILYLLYISKSKIKLCTHVALSFLLGFGFTSYFWLPSYFEKNLTLVNILTSELASYSIHFVCSSQLWNSSWGYGGSIGNCQDGLSFEVGKMQLVLSLISFVLAIYFLLKKRKNMERNTLIAILAFGLMLGLSLFLMVHASKPIWDALPVLWYVQFPWRFLLIAGFIASFLSGALLYFARGVKRRIGFSIVLSVVLIAINSQYFVPERYLAVQDSYYTNIEKIRWDTSSLAYEYVPKEVKTVKTKYNTTAVDIKKSEINKADYKVLEGNLIVQKGQTIGSKKVFNIESNSGGILRVNTFAFPGWKITIDGKEAPYTTDNKLSLIDILVTPGKHVVQAEFKNTPVRAIGNMTSILSIIGIWIVGLFQIMPYGRKSNKKT